MAGNTLRVDLEQARMDAQQLKNLAQECRDVWGQAKSLAGAAENSWRGDSGSQMQVVLTNWMTKQNTTADQLESTANAILQYVATVEEADRKMAQAIANNANVAAPNVCPVSKPQTSANNITIINRPQSETTQSKPVSANTSTLKNKDKGSFDDFRDAVENVGDIVEDVAESVGKLFKKFF